MYQASDIAEFALRFCGVTTIYDTAPDAEQFQIALSHVNLLLAEKTGTNQYWWNVPAEQEVLLDVGVSEYALDNELASSTKLMMVKDVHLIESDTKRRTPLILIRRYDFTAGYNPSLDVGTPQEVYIERKGSPKLYVLPTPTLAGQKLILTGIQYPLDIEEDGGQVDTNFPDAWARYLSLCTALDIGAGPVVALPTQRMARLEKMMIMSERALKRFNNRENLQAPRYTRPRGF